MNHHQVQKWLDGYVAAWRSGDPDEVGALFAPDATYGYRPWDADETTITGREEIVASWLESPDDPSSWEAAYTPYAVDGEKAVAIGTTTYVASEDHDGRSYHNAFVLRFDDDGRCVEFHEYYVRKKA